MNATVDRAAEQVEPWKPAYARMEGLPDGLGRARDAENLRLLGCVTAGVCHDLRNIFNGLSLQLRVLSRAGSVEDRGTLDELGRSVSHGVELLDRIRELAGGHVQPKVEIDLGLLAAEACELSKMRIRFAGQATLVLRLAPEPRPRVVANPGEVLSAVMNLVLNAVDATPPGGTVVVTTGDDQRGAWVSVSDEGPGIPAAVRRQIFEPFFSTKGAGGTGLGLTRVLECAHRHGGSVELETTVGRGTTFTLRLPESDVVERTPATDAVRDVVVTSIAAGAEL